MHIDWKRKEYKRAAVLLLSLLLLSVPAKIFFYYFRDLMPYLPPCPSIALTGLYCPGCGTTRALYCLFNGNFGGIFANNPMMPPGLIIIAALLIKPELNRHYRIITGFTILLIIYTVLRNLPWYPFTLLAPAGI